VVVTGKWARQARGGLGEDGGSKRGFAAIVLLTTLGEGGVRSTWGRASVRYLMIGYRRMLKRSMEQEEHGVPLSDPRGNPPLTFCTSLVVYGCRREVRRFHGLLSGGGFQ
jgi:hypothetical protein